MAARRDVRSLVLALLAAAVVLAVGLVAVAVVAARSLEARADAVRQGTLIGLAHELEAELRETGPDGAGDTVAAFCAAHTAELAGVVVAAASAELARCGSEAGAAVEVPLMLGPAWRGRIMGGGAGHGGGRGQGVRVRLVAVPGLGSSSGLARLVLLGAAVGALALVALALVAARGILQRERLAAVEAERERLEGLALAGAGLAHRVRNPLGAIKGTAQMLADQLGEPARGRAARIVEASVRIESLLGRLLTFARPPEAHPERLDLAALAREVTGRCAGPVSVRAGVAVWVHADREHLESILEELLANARAFDAAGELEVALRVERGVASLEVLDRGSGPEVEPSQAFEPWVTTRPEGTGLGLAIVRALAHANRGTVSLRPREGGGSVARLELAAEA